MMRDAGWFCGSVVLWFSGSVVLWFCGVEEHWMRGDESQALQGNGPFPLNAVLVVIPYHVHRTMTDDVAEWDCTRTR